jgi:UDP-hydrolysing UDP-N-acetyl-D-glucosamine 2-epimerase
MRIAILTTGRQDWGILRSIALTLRDDPAFEPMLIAGGMHASAHFGRTHESLADDGFPPDLVVPWIDDGRPETPAWEQAGLALSRLGDAFASLQPHALLLAGDRFETLAAAQAATLQRIPIIHLHGGEETAGALDNAIRHAISKLSHLHLVSHATYAQRLIAHGEDPATIHVVGAPGLDNLHRRDLPDANELADWLDLPLAAPVVIVTVHPTTLAEDPAADARAVAEAMDRVPATYVVTLPNADPGHAAVRRTMELAARQPHRTAVEALGERRYWALMRHADAMLGNSSSALIEAPALHLPAVNVGDRQGGRLRGSTVTDVGADPAAIAAALRRALTPGYRDGLRQDPGAFGDGHAAGRIRTLLAAWQPPQPPVKTWTYP